MRLNPGEREVWAACFASRYSKEAAQGRNRSLCARTAAQHASNALEALRSLTNAKDFDEDERAHLVDILGLGEA